MPFHLILIVSLALSGRCFAQYPMIVGNYELPQKVNGWHVYQCPLCKYEWHYNGLDQTCPRCNKVLLSSWKVQDSPAKQIKEICNDKNY